MSDIKLFSMASGTAAELPGTEVALEKSLQTLIENNLEALLGVRFLASEHSTGPNHGGRIDSLGLDENGSPVIIEYKRSSNENVINQGLYYLDWLMDHQGDFELLVMKALGKEVAETIDWSSPRLICIAGGFTKFDDYAVKQMGRNIELIRYKSFGEDLLLLELVNATMAPAGPAGSGGAKSGSSSGRGSYKTVTEYLEQSPQALKDLYQDLRALLVGLGDDVQEKTLKFYFAFKRIKNFATVEVHPASRCLVLCLKVDPDSVELEEGFTRDMRGIGHLGTGDLEVRIQSQHDIDRARHLIDRSYQAS